MPRNERALRALALMDEGVPASEVARKLGYRSGNSVRVIVFHLRREDNAHRRRIYLDLRHSVYDDLIALSREWKCSVAEVARSLVVCGIEDLKSEEGE